MKLISLVVAAALMFLMPQTASAISLTITATVQGESSLGPHILLKCDGATYNASSDPFAQCQNLQTATNLDFGTLTNRLFNTSGQDIGGAGVFYARNFFIVYLYPDALGGASYDLVQQPAAFPIAIQNSVVFTPVYSQNDAYSSTTGPQGALTSQEITNNPQLGVGKLARTGGRILRASRGRIVRAEYGIPPNPGTGQTRPTGWQPIPLTTASGTYTSGTIVISITQI